MGDYAVVPNIIDNSLKPDDKEILEPIPTASTTTTAGPASTGFFAKIFTMRTLFIVVIIVGLLLLTYVIYTYFTMQSSGAKSPVQHTEVFNKKPTQSDINLAELSNLREQAQRRREQKADAEKQKVEQPPASLPSKQYLYEQYLQQQQQQQQKQQQKQQQQPSAAPEAREDNISSIEVVAVSPIFRQGPKLADVEVLDEEQSPDNDLHAEDAELEQNPQDKQIDHQDREDHEDREEDQMEDLKDNNNEGEQKALDEVDELINGL
jgi:hypothetical protein